MKQTSKWSQIAALANSLVVSCQADDGEPLATKECINALSLSAIAGGAKGVRLEGIENIQIVRKNTKLPIIGLVKSKAVDHSKRADSVYITATANDATQIAQAGADIVALDATGRNRPDGTSLKEMIELIHKLDKPTWADIATIEEARQALELGADVISTTMYGYTQDTLTATDTPPDFELLCQIAKESTVPVVLEGRVWQVAEITKAFECGVWAVVVGSAITRPRLITQRFIAAIPT
jgi:N-acylglucosamine-6-phosphate 2-epimerase